MVEGCQTVGILYAHLAVELNVEFKLVCHICPHCIIHFFSDFDDFLIWLHGCCFFCLFALMLYVHHKQLRSCWDRQIS